MKILKETTIWNCEHAVPNHTYLLDGKGKVIAYANESDGSISQLKTGFILDKRYRKFIEVKNPALSQLIEKPIGNVRIFKVKSKDKEYTVQLQGKSLSCTCTGFSFRGKCKHIEAVSKQIGV
jgi:hypothetical protein